MLGEEVADAFYKVSDLSILYLRCAVDHVGYCGVGLHAAFNSLFEMRRRNGVTRSQWQHISTFNSLFEMRDCQRLVDSDVLSDLSILYLRCSL